MVEKKEVVVSTILMFILLIVSIYLFYFQTRTDVTPAYLSFYIPMGLFTIAIASMAFMFMFTDKEPWYSRFAFLWDDNEDQRPLYKYGFWMSIGFMAFTAFTLLTTKTLLYPIPAAFTSMAVSSTEGLFLTAIVPGLLEDFVYGIVAASLIAIVIGVMLKDLFDNKMVKLGVYAISAFSVAILFALMHHSVYQQNIPAFISAFIFMGGQSFIYLSGGKFFPGAHIVHNTLAVLALNYSIGIAFI